MKYKLTVIIDGRVVQVHFCDSKFELKSEVERIIDYVNFSKITFNIEAEEDADEAGVRGAVQ